MWKANATWSKATYLTSETVTTLETMLLPVAPY